MSSSASSTTAKRRGSKETPSRIHVGFIPPGAVAPPTRNGTGNKSTKNKSHNNNNNSNNNNNKRATGKQAPQQQQQRRHHRRDSDDDEDDDPRGSALPTFASHFDAQTPVPARLRHVPMALVEAVNDFHYAMMNDMPRNEFYYARLRAHVTPSSGVLEIGAGSGLLSMMAAQLGAKWVVAVEGSAEMAALARANVAANGLQDRVTVLNMLSTQLTRAHLPAAPDILVSEIFGTMLLGESVLDYIADVRQRGVLREDTVVIPQHGVQYAVPISCPTLQQLCAVSAWNGIDLSHVMALQDTVSVVFTKQYGFRMSSVPYTRLAAPIELLHVDFADPLRSRKALRRSFAVDVTATHTGTAHAWLYYWTARDGDAELTTCPESTRDNMPRDMQWGQALQLIDANTQAAAPQPLHMHAGTRYAFRCTTSADRVVLHLQHLPQASGGAAGSTAAAAASASHKPRNNKNKKNNKNKATTASTNSGKATHADATQMSLDA